MAQHDQVDAPVRRYTRLDFAALRYRFNKIPTAMIRDRLFSEQTLEERGIETDAQLEAWLNGLRDQLIERARLNNPHISKNLEDARTFNSWPASTVNYLIQAGEKDQAAPRLEDSLGVWLRPLVSKALAVEGIVTVADLKRTIEARGDGWFRPVPRIGERKAKSLERWLIKNADTLGQLMKPVERVPEGQVQLSGRSGLVPLERISNVASELDGSSGKNRNHAFVQIQARNDLQAIQAYLYRYRDVGKAQTLRAYRKELERYLLWCVLYRKIPLSSALTDDCEAYKDFLKSPDPAWMGPKVPRSSPRWRPFEKALSAESQRYAVLVLRAFFHWLADVRYLGGNPWVTVADPSVDVREYDMDIDKALPSDLWSKLIGPAGILARAVNEAESPQEKAQYRLAHAAIELMGATGIRREEAANAMRSKLSILKPTGKLNPAVTMWELSVLGKGRKWRTVFLPAYVVDVIESHWADRGHDFRSASNGDMALISPVIIPTTPSAQLKHLKEPGSTELTGNGFSPDGLYQVVKSTLIRLANDEQVPLSEDERKLLSNAAPHALRHTFATQVTAGDVPIDVAQGVLGHASATTTAIYVKAEKARKANELSKFFALQATPEA